MSVIEEVSSQPSVLNQISQIHTKATFNLVHVDLIISYSHIIYLLHQIMPKVLSPVFGALGSAALSMCANLPWLDFISVVAVKSRWSLWPIA